MTARLDRTGRVFFRKTGLTLERPRKQTRSKAFYSAMRKAKRTPGKLVHWHD